MKRTLSILFAALLATRAGAQEPGSAEPGPADVSRAETAEAVPADVPRAETAEVAEEPEPANAGEAGFERAQGAPGTPAEPASNAAGGGVEPPDSGSVYDRVYSKLSSFDQRRVGSAELDASFAAIEAELRAAGLEPHYETFDSIVQETERLEVSYGGAPAKALMIDNGAAAFVTDGPIEGPAIFVGDGSLARLDGRDLSGAVAIVDATLPGATVEEAFTHGAAAAVLVGGPGLDQWRLSGVAFTSVSPVPRVYMDRADAEAAGLLAADGSKALRIDGRAVLKDAAGKNLWVELPAKAGWQAKLGSEEVVLLTATVDTWGLTPDFSPSLRDAANAALLADTVCALAAEGPLNRRVVAVFLGSRAGGQEGARFLYHAIDLADSKRNALGFAERGEGYLEELAETTNLIACAEAGNVVNMNGPAARELKIRLRTELAGMANRLRPRMEELRTSIAALPAGDPAAEPLHVDLEALERLRASCNKLREQLSSGLFDPSADPGVQGVYDARMGDILDALRLREAELRRFLGHNASWAALSAVFRGRTVVGHYDFDFASAKGPWMLTMMNAKDLYHSNRYTHSANAYSPVLAAIRNLYYGTNGLSGARSDADPAGRFAPDAEDRWEAPLYRKTLDPTFKPYSLAAPGQRMVPTALSRAMGLAGFQMVTLGDSLPHDGMPLREPADLSGLRSQMRAFCAMLGNAPELSIRPLGDPVAMETRLTYSGDSGAHYQNYAAGSTESEGLPPRAIAWLSGFLGPVSSVGQGVQPRARILANGRVYMPFIGRETMNTMFNGAVGYGTNGAPDRVANMSDARGIVATPVHLFYAYGGLAFNEGYAPDPLGGALYHPERLVASKDAPHKTFAHVEFDEHGPDEYFADRPDPIKVIGSGGDMLLGSAEPEPGEDRVQAAMGHGVPLDAAHRLRSDNIALGARDLYLLDEVRLAVLRDRNIVRDDLERLHADARDHLDAAGEAAAARKWSLARAHEIFAACIENRLYRPLRGITEDLVEAVVVLLLLNIPFAFAMERLIFGFPSIYRQLGGFAGFFLATFGILYVTHPAFSLASAPIIIFLAFVIIMLGLITSGVMMGKIKQEIRAMQGLSSTVHGVESDSSTTLSAILIGIAGMRNRPLKTFLTCITVVLLTFTILVFASFTSSQGTVETYLGRGSGENRIELHRISHLEIDDHLLGSIRTLYGDRFELARRGGLFRVPTRPGDVGSSPTNPERVLYVPRTGDSFRIDAVMGADPAEFELSEGFARVCPDFAKRVCPGPEDAAPMYLPPAVTNALPALAVGDEIRLNGVPFRFAGVFDAGALQGLATIDNHRVLPPDFQSTLANNGANETSGASATRLEEFASGSFEYFSPDVVALARMDDLLAAFGDLCMVNFLSLYPKDSDVDVDAAAAELAPVFQGAVHVKSPSGARQLFFTNAVAGSGLADVLVPLLLGGLIIFSSLMGSIVVREKEIFTYSALGLAPVDVGALFFAESAVYSVVGGMGGYLFSQLVAKLMKWMGSMGWVTPLEMNFSSLTSVCTILIVMAVVMLSTVFPAMRASKSANPGVARKWKMPAPKGDSLSFVFPFTVSTPDFAGILSFIREHFENHADASLGAFAARDVRLFREPAPDGGKERLGIEANVSLAPFDLGIFQKFRMYSQEFEIKGIDEVVVDLKRIGGTPDSWVRSNRAFASELREQFLLWRSLPIGTIEHYRSETRKTLGIS